MALKLRMARGGRRNLPYYRIVVTDSRNPRDGKFSKKSAPITRCWRMTIRSASR